MGCAPAKVAETVTSLLPKPKAAPPTDVRSSVRAAYAATATGGAGVLPGDVGDIAKRSAKLGYGARRRPGPSARVEGRASSARVEEETRKSTASREPDAAT